MSELVGIYRPGTTLLHRLPAWTKLLALLGYGVAVVVVRGAPSALAALAVAGMLLVWSRTRLALLLRTLRGLLLVAALLAAYLAWQQDWGRAVETVTDLVALGLLATVVTATTRVDEVLDAVTGALRPLRRLGVDPDRVALAFALTIRAIPTTLALAQETRDAARARGLDRDPRARLTPLVIRVVAHARATGEALHARGVGD